MKTFYTWQSASINDRLSVYDNYVYLARKRRDTTCLDFEEFDDLYYNHSFYSVANKFGVAD